MIQSAAISATLLMGMAFIFADVGGLEFSKIISVLFSRHEMSSLFVLGAVMMLVATAFKLSAAPFHHWVSDVYEGAPAPITAFLASVSKVAMMALLVRFLLLTASWGLSPVLTVLLVMTVLSILFGKIIFTWIEYTRIGICLPKGIGNIKDIGFESYNHGLVDYP